MTDLTNKTAEELQARFVESGTEFTRLANERQEILAEMQRREKVASVTVRLGALSDDEKEALRQVLGPSVEARAQIAAESGLIEVSK